MRCGPLFAFITGLALTTGCKAKHEDKVEVGSAAPVGGVAIQGDASAIDELRFGPGENYFGGARSTTNVHEWKTPDGATIRLVVVSTGKDANGEETGVLRVYRDGKSVPVGQVFALNTSGDHWAELKAMPNGRVLFRYGDARDNRRARNAVLLRYDADAKEVRIAKRWTGGPKAEEPAWVTTGEYKPVEGTNDVCAKVVARMVACAKDEGFRRSLTAREQDETQRSAVLASLDKDLATWKTPAGVKRQCARWGSDEYIETTFAERTKLEGLAKDAAEAKLSCELFGAEIVDEGGLPQLSTQR